MRAAFVLATLIDAWTTYRIPIFNTGGAILLMQNHRFPRCWRLLETAFVNMLHLELNFNRRASLKRSLPESLTPQTTFA